MRAILVACLCATVLPFALSAQDEIIPQTYGTASQVVLQIPAVSFVPVDGGDKFEDTSGQVYHGGPGNKLVTGVMLPAGARLEAMDFYYDQGGAPPFMAANLYTLEGTTTNTVTTLASVFGTVPGKNVATVSMNHTVTNSNRQYVIYVTNTNSLKKFRAVALRYKLQISPAPGSPTFPNDVPVTHPFYQFIEALAAAGITAGCGPGSYCPDSPLTRGQMAVFLSRALGLHWAP